MAPVAILSNLLHICTDGKNNFGSGGEPGARCNLRMIELARSLGFAAKFTGSGGAVVLLFGTKDGHLSEAEEVDFASRFAREDFVFSRLRVKQAERGILDE